ncbi:MAG: tRNA lysidine(34) synthetase TilS [Bacteroidales bacterium]|nr:tRNA lysidine(34) synthetase TilS [Bacteroidales bacterium]
MKVLLAVSGGIDSMTMADIMFSHSRLYEGLAIAHCNFHLRPGDCDQDAELVEQWAAARGLKFHKVDFDTLAYAREHGVSIEMAARELRYGWFAQLCADEGYDAVAVAHNANDNAETLMLNLLRGTGLKGICGMSDGKVRHTSSHSYKMPPAVIRPLLGMTRAEIEGYAKEHDVPFRTDKTNLENEYSRNKIRNQVFPLFSEINASFVQVLNRDMQHFSAASAIVEDWCTEKRAEVMDGESIVVSRLLSVKHWEYLLYDILESYGFSSAVMSDVCRLLSDTGATFSGKCFDGPEFRLYSVSDRLLISPKADSSEPQFVFEQLPYDPAMDLRCPSGTLIYDADKLPADALIRPWTDGDWLRPLGMKGKKKLSDLFTDLHLSLPEKSAIRVLASSDSSDHHVYAVLCLRIDDSLKVTSSTRTVIKVTQR